MPVSAPTVDSIAQHTLVEAVRQAAADKTPLVIRGGDSKSFYGRRTHGTVLDTRGCAGIVNYAPTELVITARGGTPVAELQAALAEREQILAFEPPVFGAAATLGGTVACGLSGPRRPYAGALRDFVLGTRIVNGRGELLRFGGEVMKNVAGYDVSRLMVGALGTLGVIAEVSLKVLPRPAVEKTVAFEVAADEAIQRLNQWAGQPLPLSATCHVDGRLYVRLSGSANGVRGACRELGADDELDGDGFWPRLREHRLDFFASRLPLWRIGVAPATPMLDLPGRWVLEWGGAQRWLVTDTGPARVRSVVRAAGGHATLFRGGDRDGEVFEPLSAGLAVLHRNLKQAFDPLGLLNAGRLYADL